MTTPARAWAAALLLAAAASCASPAAGARTRTPSAIWDLSPDVCAGCEGHRDIPACRDFRLTEEQVAIVLSRGEPITRQRFTQAYDWAPCLVHGVAAWDGTPVPFEISAFLVATLRLPDGSEQLLACDGECERAVMAAEPRR